jgi:hypothetical protein
MSKYIVTLSLVVLMCLAGQTTEREQTPAATGTDQAKHSLAVNLLRAVNTAEYAYKNNHGSYASRDVLAASKEFTQDGMGSASRNDPQLTNVQLSHGPKILPGWNLRLSLAANGKGYDALLEDTTDKTCRYAAVTDERGLIRQSKAIDCAI